MHTEFLMGNEAIALGALAAGVNVVCGYPGTPSSEVLETVAARKGNSTYVEWSVNEKAALEMAAGVAYSGGRALVTMIPARSLPRPNRTPDLLHVFPRFRVLIPLLPKKPTI